ncbi:MAG: hypothetical protein ACI4FZ_09755 [Lachnospiraceae bacterium]
MEETKKKNTKKVCGWILIILAIVLIVLGISVMVFGVTQEDGKKETAIDVYYATEDEQNVYTWMQYMSDSVAYYEDMENMQFFLTFDSNFNSSVICMHTDYLEKYQPYMDYLYSESYENAPEEILVEGFSQLFDDELKKFIIEGYNTLLGGEYITADNFKDYFGEYYLQLGRANGNFEIFNLGGTCLILGVIFLALGIYFVYERQEKAEPSGQEEVFLAPEKPHRIRGILGALLGALLGSILWTAVGMLGYVSAWIGVLMAVFARTGYKIFCGKDEKFGVIISTIFCLILVMPATYLAAGWGYYQNVNSYMAGSITLFRALKEYPVYLSSSDSWGRLLSNMVLGYVFIIIGIVIDYTINVSKKQK